MADADFGRAELQQVAAGLRFWSSGRRTLVSLGGGDVQYHARLNPNSTFFVVVNDDISSTLRCLSKQSVFICMPYF